MDVVWPKCNKCVSWVLCNCLCVCQLSVSVCFILSCVSSYGRSPAQSSSHRSGLVGLYGGPEGQNTRTFHKPQQHMLFVSVSYCVLSIYRSKDISKHLVFSVFLWDVLIIVVIVLWLCDCDSVSAVWERVSAEGWCVNDMLFWWSTTWNNDLQFSWRLVTFCPRGLDLKNSSAINNDILHWHHTLCSTLTCHSGEIYFYGNEINHIISM